MRREDWNRLWLVALLVTFAHTADLASTWAASPRLAGEFNLLQSRFGYGWSGLVAGKVIGIGLAIAGYAYYLCNRTACYPPPGESRSAFCRHFASGRAMTWFEMQFRRSDLRNRCVNLGYFWAGMQMFVLWAAVENLLLINGFVVGARAYSEMGYHVIQGLTVATLVLWRLYAGNYRRYAALTPDPSPPALVPRWGEGSQGEGLLCSIDVVPRLALDISASERAHSSIVRSER